MQNEDRLSLKSLIEKEIEALRNIPLDNPLDAAVDLIYQQVHQTGGKVVIAGMGKAGQIGMNIGTTLSSTGTPAVFIHPMEAQHGDLGVIQKNDVLLLISNSGITDEILILAKLAKNLHPNLILMSLTGSRNGQLNEMADISLITGKPNEICPLGLTPTTSTTVMTVVGDLLVVRMIEKIGFTKEEYAKRHHSGYLGRKAKDNG
jgi:arabinose-5-phosphate isomerase